MIKEAADQALVAVGLMIKQPKKIHMTFRYLNESY